MPDQAVILRPAVQADLGAINDIYNYYVLHSTCTFQEVPETLEDRLKWFDLHDHQHPVIVIEREDQVLGWGSLSPYHSRSAFRHTVENSIYIHHQFQRRGLGSLLLSGLIARARGLGHRAIIAAIEGGQNGSLALHAGYGFEKVGQLSQVGYKFGQWIDLVYMELRLKPAAAKVDTLRGR